MKKTILLINQLTKAYNSLIRDLSQLNGIVYQTNSIFDRYLKEEKSAKRPYNKLPHLMSTLAFYSPYTGEILFGYKYRVSKINVQKRTLIIKRKINNYYLSQAYEAFEFFLRTITSKIATRNITKAIEYDERLGFSSHESCYLFLTTQYRNNNDVMKLLRFLIPELDNQVNQHDGLMNYLNLYRTYGKCRNVIVHNKDIISKPSFNRFAHKEKLFARDWFGVDISNKSSKYIVDTSNSSQRILSGIVELAFLILTCFEPQIKSRLDKKKNFK